MPTEYCPSEPDNWTWPDAYEEHAMSAAAEQLVPQAPAALPELLDPATGEVLEGVDSLVDALERAQLELSRLRAFEQSARIRLAAMAPSDDPEQVTRRLRGERRRVKIELPGLVFDQAILRDIVAQFPMSMTRPVVKVESYKVVLTEFKKLANESGPPEFEQFRLCLQGACKGRIGLAKVTVEE